MGDPPRAELDRVAEALVERQARIVEPDLHPVVRRRLGDHELEAVANEFCVPLRSVIPTSSPNRSIWERGRTRAAAAPPS